MRNKGVAILVMVLLIAIALPLGVHNSVKPLKSKAEGEFSYDDSGFSITQAVWDREECADNIVKVAEKYKEHDDSLVIMIDDLERVVNRTKNIYGIDRVGELAAANKEIDAPANEIVEHILSMDKVTDADSKALKAQQTQMTSMQAQISHSSYNKSAQEYNDRLEQFPVNVLKYVAFLKPLDLFV